MDKRGAELGLNWIIIAVLAVLVLIVASYFFLSGSGGVTGTIRDIFRGTTSGISKSISVENCIQMCRQLENYPVALRGKSPFCTTNFKIDEDNDGEAQKVNDEYVKYYCQRAGAASAGAERDLGVPCRIREETFSCPG
ncbi:MAG: hypothetical protein AABW87_00035 [Nanoarchaeota archaeon]